MKTDYIKDLVEDQKDSQKYGDVPAKECVDDERVKHEFKEEKVGNQSKEYYER